MLSDIHQLANDLGRVARHEHVLRHGLEYHGACSHSRPAAHLDVPCNTPSCISAAIHQSGSRIPPSTTQHCHFCEPQAKHCLVKYSSGSRLVTALREIMLGRIRPVLHAENLPTSSDRMQQCGGHKRRTQDGSLDANLHIIANLGVVVPPLFAGAPQCDMLHQSHMVAHHCLLTHDHPCTRASKESNHPDWISYTGFQHQPHALRCQPCPLDFSHVVWSSQNPSIISEP